MADDYLECGWVGIIYQKEGSSGIETFEGQGSCTAGWSTSYDDN
jgi:hypothetical protein